MDATWSDLLEALESPSSVSVSLPTFPPHESAVACSDSDSYQLELVVRAAQRKRRLEAQAQDAGKAFEDAICAYFFHPSTLPLQNHQQPGRGLVRSKSLASTPLSRGRRQWKFPSSPLTPASSQLWLDSARRLEELDRSVDLMLEDTSKERRFVSTIRPRYSPNASATVKKTCYHMGSLPSEVLIQIFLQLSKDSSSVLSITHVNYRWREIALGIPSLFTSTALWDKWSLPLLKEWIARTKGKPLSVKLSNEALLRMHTEDNIRALIHDVCMEELDVTVATFGQSGDALNACRAILHLEMPLLRKLRLVGSNDIGICSPILDVPGRLITSLTHLRLSNALLIFKDYDTAEKRDLDPSPSRSLAIDNASVPTGSWIGFWRGCHGFNAMKLSRCGVSEGHLTSPPPSLELPNITRMVFSESTGVLGLTMIRSCRFSNLRHLTIKGGPALTEEMWIALVSNSLIETGSEDHNPVCTGTLCSEVEHN